MNRILIFFVGLLAIGAFEANAQGLSKTAWMHQYVKGASAFMFFVDKDVAMDVFKNGTDAFIGDARLSLNRTKKGAFSGYKIRRIMPGSVIQGLGLEVDDVLLSVNEMSVEHPEKLLKLAWQIHLNGIVSLRILRQGRPLTLTYVVS